MKLALRPGRMTALYIVLAVLVVLGIWVMTSYNGLVGAKTEVESDWAQVETQYQRRMDVIPNLVNTVKGSAEFEQETLTAVTEARTKFLSAGNRTDQINAAASFDNALSRLLVTVEAYPQIKSTQAFTDLMAAIEGTENRISTARKDFNEEVARYNVKVKTFPTVIFAGMFGYAPEKFFEAKAGAEDAPTVSF